MFVLCVIDNNISDLSTDVRCKTTLLLRFPRHNVCSLFGSDARDSNIIILESIRIDIVWENRFVDTNRHGVSDTKRNRTV